MDYFKLKRQKKARYNLSIYLMIIIAYAIVMILSSQGKISSLLNGLLVPFCTYSILAVSLNLVVGISGELSLGHAGFMCVGAFTSAVFTRYMKFLGVEGLYLFIIAILIGAVTAGFAGLLIGIPVLRLKGDYLAIVTLAFGEIIKNIANAIYLGFDENGAHFSLKNTMALGLSDKGFVVIKGAQGITGTPHYSSFTAGVILLIIVVTIILNLVNSRTGRNINWCCWRSICSQLNYSHCSSKKLWIQYVNNNSCIRSSWWYGKNQRFYNCCSSFNSSTRDA